MQPPGRYGLCNSLKPQCGFQEKPHGDGGWINGGFFVLEPEVIDRIEGDATLWEQEPLKGLVQDGELTAYHHTAFAADGHAARWQLLELLWAKGEAPWKLW